MAAFDDKKMLLAHIRHSFVTSDDTGMCELIMIKEDVEQEIENDHSYQKKSLRMQQRYKQAEKRSTNNMAASYDIQASPTLSRRPPLKNTSDMFQMMEKKKASRVRTVQWHITPLELVDRSLFAPQPIRPHPTGPSPLKQLLAEQDKKKSNPFYKYCKFNGENHGPASSNKFLMFLSMAKDPLYPVEVTVLHTATVQDLIGMTFWKYYEDEREPFYLKGIESYAVMIADDDGEIDTDLPELQGDDYISKFGFKYLGIIERSNSDGIKIEDAPAKYKIVKVYYENGGFSTIAISEDDVEMSEVLARVIRKRRLQIHGYELEKKDSPGEFINLRSSLSSQGTLDFMLVRNTRQGHTPSSSVEDDVDSPDVGTEVTSHLYTSYSVIMLHRMRSNTRVQLGIDPQRERVEIQPIEPLGRGFLAKPLKPMKYDINEISSVDVLEEKPPNTVFRIVRLSKEGSVKNIDFEGPHNVTKKIVAKLKLIIGDSPSSIKSKQK